MSALGLKLNFINFIALPITFGIGVDYSVNLFQRYLIERDEGLARREAMLRSVANAGGAVLMASLTTVIGYGSLLVARNGSLISFGQAAILGEATCLLAAILVMPAWLYGFRGRGAAARAHPPEGPRIEPTIVGSDPR
jgi:predicted RND superfamily exporter protein